MFCQTVVCKKRGTVWLTPQCVSQSYRNHNASSSEFGVCRRAPSLAHLLQVGGSWLEIQWIPISTQRDVLPTSLATVFGAHTGK